MDRKPIVGISMKIYKNVADEIEEYVKTLKSKANETTGVDVFILPSMGTLYPAAKLLENSKIGWGSQNIAPYSNGAYTGELSIESIVDLGGQYVEIGHFERRSIFAETNEMIANKVKLTIDNQLTPIICIGEQTKGGLSEVTSELKLQIDSALSKLSQEEINDVIFAYEPAWAIGKSEAAGYTYVHKIHKAIRETLEVMYGQVETSKVRLIYGGSVSLNNAENILNSDDVDGVFVGRFGHNVNNFVEIVKLA